MRRSGTKLIAAGASVVCLALGCGGGGNAATPARPEPPHQTRLVDEPPEPEDGVEIVSTKGKLEPADVEAALAPHSKTLTDCYTQGVGKQRYLGGKLELKWNIKADGSQASVQIASGNLGAWAIEQCMLEVAGAVTFPKPKGGAAEVSIPLEFTGRTVAAEPWVDVQIEKMVAPHLETLNSCEDAPAGAVITTYVGTRGKVQSVGFATPNGPLSPVWASCAVETIMSWQLADPRGKVVKLSFPFGSGGLGLRGEDQ